MPASKQAQSYVVENDKKKGTSENDFEFFCTCRCFIYVKNISVEIAPLTMLI